MGCVALIGMLKLTCLKQHEVWVALIQAKPSVSKWMNKPVRNYGKLYDIYGEDRANGDGAESAREKEVNLQRGKNVRKASMIEVMEKQFEYVTESMNKVASVLQEGNAIKKDSNMIEERAVDVVEKGRQWFYNEEEIYYAIHELGLHRNMQLDAYLFLINNNTAARSFFGTCPAMHAEVLMKMMNLL
ncbi:hypothetical protein MRB53_035141 [Persea americana]|uniref:Uncharacterized protein n=1 Tax=Persea americana TaxID=3435 RepID=A0ACC2K3V5_PERAE|nr:hypothetical protein MRB53_035141 [Persea americana]